MSDVVASQPVEAPTEPGFYKYDGGKQNMIFLLVRNDAGPGQWYALFDNSEFNKCEWSYIEQCLTVWKLEKIK